MTGHVTKEDATAYVVALLKDWGYLQVKVTEVKLIWESGQALTTVEFSAFNPCAWKHDSGRFDVWFDGEKIYGEW